MLHMRWDSRADNLSDELPISAATTKFFYDQEAAVSLIRYVRWNGGHYCPRCRSMAIKKVNSFFVNEIFQCNDCQYNFNSTSGTLFHGSKMRLDTHLLLAVALDCLARDIPAKELAALIGVSQRTLKLQSDKIGPVATPDEVYLTRPDFALADRQEFDSLLDLLERRGFKIQMKAFLKRLNLWI